VAKRAVVGSIVGGVLLTTGLLMGITYLWVRYRDEARIHAAELRAEQMRVGRESLYVSVRMRDSLEGVMQERVADLLRASDQLRNQVIALERERRVNQLSVRTLRTDEALQARFASTFPEFASAFRETEIRDPVEDVELKYFMLPFRTAEAFIIEHQNGLSFKAQRDSLQALDRSNVQTIAMKDSIFALERTTRLAFQTAYDTTFASYQSLTRDYVAALKEPRVRVNVPKWPLLILTAVAGGLVGGFVF
jgi:hypothetical protein